MDGVGGWSRPGAGGDEGREWGGVAQIGRGDTGGGEVGKATVGVILSWRSRTSPRWEEGDEMVKGEGGSSSKEKGKKRCMG